jgi:hypothetical protein
MINAYEARQQTIESEFLKLENFVRLRINEGFMYGLISPPYPENIKRLSDLGYEYNPENSYLRWDKV